MGGAVREALCFVFLLVLICAGWKQSYSSHWNTLFGNPLEAIPEGSAPLPASPSEEADIPIERKAAAAVPAPTPDRSWMYKPTLMNVPHSRTGGRRGD